MADKVADKKEGFSKQIPTNVIPLGAGRCACEGCKKKSEKADFCAEHFIWFKEGMITREGMKAPDFDKKYYDFQRRSA